MNIYTHICLRLSIYLASYVFCSFGGSLYAQRQSLGAHLGVTPYSGDLNPGNLLLITVSLAVESSTDIRRATLWAFVMNLLAGSITGTDKDAPDVLGQFRNIEFDITYIEVSAVLEYYFLNPKNAHGRSISSPYLFLGAGVLTFSGHENPTADYSTIQPVVPFGLGLKIPIGRISYLDLSLGTRKTFFDYLDNISAGSVEDKNFLYGDQYNSDWYHYFSVSFSYIIQSLKCPVPLERSEHYY